MPSPISPPPVTEYLPEFIPAYLANGLVGLRVNKFPLSAGYTTINGFAGSHPIDRVESNAQAPYPLAGDLRIQDIWLSQALDHARLLEQRYDFSCGELHTRFTFTVRGITALVYVTTFCCRSLPTLVLQQVEVEVSEACVLVISAKVEPASVAGQLLARDTRIPEAHSSVIDGSLLWEAPGKRSTCGIAYSSEFLAEAERRQSRLEDRQFGALMTSYRVDARPDNRYVMRQIASLVPSILHHEPDRQAIRMTYLGRERGFEVLREENRLMWEELWKGRMHLVGADRRWQELADAAYFYLHTSTHESSPCSTGLFGLGDWHNYHYFRGHVFWDIETFVFPPLLLTSPYSARALLNYRYERIPAARANAAMHGYRGIQFPWESSPLRGEEVTPNSAGYVIHEQHISMDVAFAFAQYVHATGDTRFLQQQAWPVLEGVATWIASRVIETGRGYELRQVTGIAEHPRPVDNNAYVNMAASVVLREAIAFAQKLGYRVPPRWKAIAERLYLPTDPDTGVILCHDRYTPEAWGTCPEALAGLYPLNYQVEPALEQATLAYYLERIGSYIGSPMLSSPCGVYAARLGDRALSAQCFEQGYADFVFEPFWETDEFSRKLMHSKARTGPYLANLGGFLTACLYGLPGLQIDEGDPQHWCKRKVVLPEGWQGIEVEQLWIRDQPVRLSAYHGDERARLS